MAIKFLLFLIPLFEIIFILSSIRLIKHLINIEKLKSNTGKNISWGLKAIGYPLIAIDSLVSVLYLILPGLLLGFLYGFHEFYLKKFIILLIIPLLVTSIWSKSIKTFLSGFILLIISLTYLHYAFHYLDIAAPITNKAEIKATELISRLCFWEHRSKYGKFVLGPEMKIPRAGHQAVLLDDGRVLIVGGSGEKDGKKASEYTEFYDSTRNIFILGPKLIDNYYPSITKLNDGSVLIMSDDNPNVLIFNPTKNVFVQLYQFPYKFNNHTATLLDNNKIFITGTASLGMKRFSKQYYLFDPTTKRFETSITQNTDIVGYKTIKLSNGNVLLIGFKSWLAYNFLQNKLNKINSKKEVYTQEITQFIQINNMLESRKDHRATVLPNEDVLITGGLYHTDEYTYKYLNSVEVFDSKSKKFKLIGKMFYKRGNHQATRLKNDSILITGGNYSNDSLIQPIRQSEIFIPNKKERGQ